MPPPTVTLQPLGTFRPQAANANSHTPRGEGELRDSIQAHGWIDAQTVAADNEHISGSSRLEQAGALGFAEAIVIDSDGTRPVIIRRTDIPTATDPRAIALSIEANLAASRNLAWDAATLTAWQAEGVDLGTFWRVDELAAVLALPVDAPTPPADPYTHKILSPQYEPSEDVPPLTALFDTSRTQTLTDRIATTPDVPDDVRTFLLAAAQRHTVFNFKHIAAYYASAPAAVQDLMEDSALVIIDYADAVRLGYMRLAAEIAQLRQEDYGDEP